MPWTNSLRLRRDVRRSLVSLSFNWILHHTPVECVILGASRLEQLQHNLETLADGPLRKELSTPATRSGGPSRHYAEVQSLDASGQR